MQIPHGAPASISRRSVLSLFLASPLAAVEGKGQKFDSEAIRYADRATENLVYRLTNPENTSLFPAPSNPNVFRKRDEFLFSSDRSGSLQVHLLHWKKGDTRQMTDADKLDPDSVTLAERNGAFYYWDDHKLVRAAVNNLRGRTIYELPDGVSDRVGFSVTREESAALWVQRTGGSNQLILLDLAGGATRTLLETSEPIEDPQWRPGRRDILCRIGSGIELVQSGTGQRTPIPTETTGELGQFFWSLAGDVVFYLNRREALRESNQLRQYDPGTRKEELVAKTSQFVRIVQNHNSTVFLGASGSKAGPYITILLTRPVREFPLCEHRAQDTLTVRPTFSGDSQAIFFQSDLHGKPALYLMTVDKLIERSS